MTVKSNFETGSRQARVVVIGGGIMGVSAAYHLAAEGWTDVVLCEKAELTSGSTWHAAGQIAHAVDSRVMGWVNDYSIKLYQRLERETGQGVGWHGCGGLRVGYDDDEVDWLKSILNVGRLLDLPMDLVGPNEVKAANPHYNVEGIKAAVRTYEDGHVDPSGATQAMAAAARALGARIERRNRVTGAARRPSGEWRVETQAGEIAAEHVVIAAGSFARQVGAWFGLSIPSVSILHHYFVTDTVPEFRDAAHEIPVMRDNSCGGYIRQEQQSGLIGVFENTDAPAVWLDGAPWESENELFEPDYEAVAPFLERAFDRMPILAELGIRRVVRGAIAHTPDGPPLVGPAPATAPCGSPAARRSASPGPAAPASCSRTSWSTGRRSSPFDSWTPAASATTRTTHTSWKRAGRISRSGTTRPCRATSARRAGPGSRTPSTTSSRPRGRCSARCTGASGPAGSRPAAAVTAAGAAAGVRARATETGADRGGAGRGEGGTLGEDANGWRRQPWHAAVGRECDAVAGAAGLLDLTAFSKFEISGRDAGTFLDRLSANPPPAEVGRVRLAHLLTPAGHFETELTVTRLAQDRFYAGSAIAGERKDLDWLRFHRRPGEAVTIRNLTSEWGFLALSGPRSREILGAVTGADLSNEAFPWLSAREAEVADRPCLLQRISFTGELGWELHMPLASMEAIYTALFEAGARCGLRDVGGHALDSLRMEKAYPGSRELTPEIGMVEAGLMRFFKPDHRSFVGARRPCASASGGCPVRWSIWKSTPWTPTATAARRSCTTGGWSDSPRPAAMGTAPGGATRSPSLRRDSPPPAPVSR